MKVGVGHGEDIDSADAAALALARALAALDGAAPRAALIFTGIGVDPRAVLDTLDAGLPGVPRVGCTTTAEVSRAAGALECSVLLVLLAGDQLEVGVGFGVEDDAARSATSAVDRARAALRTPAKLCVCFANGVARRLGDIPRALAARLGPDVLIVGGGSSDEVGTEEMRPKELFGREVLEGSVTVLLLGGNVRVAHALGLGWTPVGTPHAATKVLEGQLLAELDGRAAAEVFHDYLGVEGGTGISFVHHPLAVEVDDGTLLRGAYAPGPMPGSYLLAGDVAEGARLRFCEFDRGALLSSSQEAAASALAAWQGAPPAAALVFECLTRWTVLGTSAARSGEHVRRVLPAETAVAGAYLAGEFAPFRAGQAAHVHNCSIVVVLLGGE